MLCRRKAHGGSFNTAKKQLVEGGYVGENRGLVQVQKLGCAYLGEAPPVTPLNNAALIQCLIEALPTPAKEILTALAEYRSPMTAEALGTALNRGRRGGRGIRVCQSSRTTL